MKLADLREFFEDDNRRLSMSRLLVFCAFVPATIEVIRINTADALLWFLGAFVTGYVGGKGVDALRKPQKTGDDAA